MTEKSNKNGEWQDLVDHCFDLYEQSKKSTYRKAKLKDIKESYRVYHQKEPKANKFWKGESKLVLPLHSITVDNLEPRLVAGLVGKEPIVQFEEDGLNEQRPETKTLENWYNDELAHTVKIKKTAGTVTHKALMEGTVFPIVGYDEDDVIRRKFIFQDVLVPGPDGGPQINPQTRQPVTKRQMVFDEKAGEPVTEDIVESIFRGGRVTYADFADVFIPDEVDDWEKTPVIRIVRPTYGELMNKKDQLGYQNIDEDLLSEKIDKLKESPAVGDIKLLGKEPIECLECSISYVESKKGKETKDDEDITDWTEKRYVALITLNTKTLIRIVPLIDLNFKNQHLIKRIRLFGEEGKAYGTSMYEKLKAIQTGATDLYNQVINVATICMIPWFLYNDSSGMDQVENLKPGVGIKVDDPSGVMFPKFNQNPRSYIAFIEMFMSLWEQVGSIGDIQTGRISSGKGDVTATETMAAIQEGNIKHNYQSVSLKADFIEVVRTLYDMYYQKMPFDAYFIRNGQRVDIPREAMQRRYTFKIVGSTDMSNKVISMQKADTMYKALRQDPMVNPIPIIADMVEAHNEDSSPEKYINPKVNQFMQIMQQNPELEQVIQQHLQNKQQQMQQKEQQAQQQQMDRGAEIAGKSAGNAIVQGQMAQ